MMLVTTRLSLRDKEYFKGRWWDVLLYATIEDEWRARLDVPGAPYESLLPT